MQIHSLSTYIVTDMSIITHWKCLVHKNYYSILPLHLYSTMEYFFMKGLNMATVIKSISDLTRIIELRVQKALEMTQKEIFEVVQEHLTDYYHEFTPVMYHRTWTFLNSLIKTDIIKIYISKIAFYILKTATPTNDICEDVKSNFNR